MRTTTPSHRVEAHPAEPARPVQTGERGHGLGVRPEVVDRRAERADETRARPRHQASLGAQAFERDGADWDCRSRLAVRRRLAVGRPFLAQPDALPLAAPDDTGHRLRAFVAVETPSDAFDGLADIRRSEPRQDHRRLQPTGRRSPAERQEVRPEPLSPALAAEPPNLPRAEVGVPNDLALVDVGDLDLDDQVRAVLREEGVRRLLALRHGPQIGAGALPHIEGAVRLHAGAAGLSFPAQSNAPQFGGGAAERARGGVHDVVEDPGQPLVEGRRGHEDYDFPDRVQPHPAEPARPVQAREGGHGGGVRPEAVDRRAERPHETRTRARHQGSSVLRPSSGTAETAAASGSPSADSSP